MPRSGLTHIVSSRVGPYKVGDVRKSGTHLNGRVLFADAFPHPTYFASDATDAAAPSRCLKCAGQAVELRRYEGDLRVNGGAKLVHLGGVKLVHSM